MAAEDARLREQVQGLLAANATAAHQAREEARLEASRLDHHAEQVAASNDHILDRIASAVEDVKAVGDLLSGGVNLASAPSFDLGGAPEAQPDTVEVRHALDGADVALSFASPMSSLPFALLRNVVDAQLRLQADLFESLGSFERADSRFQERDFVTEFGERAFGPRAFLGTLADHVVGGWVSERYVAPAVHSLYRRVDPPAPRPMAHHFWSARSSPVARPVQDARGATLLFDRQGRSLHVDSPAELERVVADTNVRPRYQGYAGWEEGALVWAPAVDDEDPWWMDTAADPAWWVSRAVETELSQARRRLGGEAGRR